ncbi:DUF2630 family protein [Allorhizocola rhizosphaerae]|uniref:DUF2630 family protein n=1 Tax=Allorhizocola rhizosphaerae TaxID=1872709 RepID=UPI001B8BE465|nr:DUF2630 family protein [Allorhizocola rhizosphaerae]
MVVDDKQILGRITELVEEEHRLRERREAGQVDTQQEADRLRDLEESLDQCWDLLRRRRAARAQGQDPDTVNPQPKTQVEGYLQ